MNLKLVPIPRSHLNSTVATWLPFINRIAEREGANPAHLIEKIQSGEVHIIVAWNADERKAEALCGMSVQLRGEKRVAYVFWLTGKGRERWVPLFPDLEEYARTHLACDAMKLEPRPGWRDTVLSHGYRITHFVAEKELH